MGQAQFFKRPATNEAGEDLVQWVLPINTTAVMAPGRGIIGPQKVIGGLSHLGREDETMILAYDNKIEGLSLGDLSISINQALLNTDKLEIKLFGMDGETPATLQVLNAVSSQKKFIIFLVCLIIFVVYLIVLGSYVIYRNKQFASKGEGEYTATSGPEESIMKNRDMTIEAPQDEEDTKLRT